MLSLKQYIVLAPAFLSSQASAICTNWTQKSVSSDTGTSFTTHYAIQVDQLACAKDATQDCQMAQRPSYDITAARDLYRSADVSLGLSDEETEAIFQLAKDGYKAHILGNVSYSEFVTLTATVSLESSQSSYRDVEPGTNKTLYWLAFYRYSIGTLNGCTNDTLNNLTVTAAAPYFTLNKQNQTVIAGTWLASWHNITEGGTSMATSTFRASTTNTLITVLLAAVLGITFIF